MQQCAGVLLKRFLRKAVFICNEGGAFPVPSLRHLYCPGLIAHISIEPGIELHTGNSSLGTSMWARWKWWMAGSVMTGC